MDNSLAYAFLSQAAGTKGDVSAKLQRNDNISKRWCWMDAQSADSWFLGFNL